MAFPGDESAAGTYADRHACSNGTAYCRQGQAGNPFRSFRLVSRVGWIDRRMEPFMSTSYNVESLFPASFLSMSLYNCALPQ
jgi:hypothetical protein